MMQVDFESLIALELAKENPDFSILELLEKERDGTPDDLDDGTMVGAALILGGSIHSLDA